MLCYPHPCSDKKRHVITTTTEHKCVLDSCRSLEQDGFKVTYLPVQVSQRSAVSSLTYVPCCLLSGALVLYTRCANFSNILTMNTLSHPSHGLPATDRA